MEISIDTPGSEYYIQSHQTQGIKINNVYHSTSFIVHSHTGLLHWAVQYPEHFKPTDLNALFEHSADVVLLGVGETQIFLPDAFMEYVLKQQQTLEVQTTLSACRTFNLLASEGRKVVMGMILP